MTSITQVFVNIKAGGLRKQIKPVKNFDLSDALSAYTANLRGKPSEGGLWTTDDGYTWTNHILDNLDRNQYLKYQLPQNNEAYWEFYYLTAPNPNLYTVDSKADYNALKERFLLDSIGMFDYLNWEGISQNYDGIRLTKNGLLQTSRELFGWEVPQTLWFRWGFEEPDNPCHIPVNYK